MGLSDLSGSASVGSVARGFTSLLASSVTSRLVSFVLNLFIARRLTPEAYGLSAIQFHLITTTILLLSREGVRRGCLRFGSNEVSFPMQEITHGPG